MEGLGLRRQMVIIGMIPGYGDCFFDVIFGRWVILLQGPATVSAAYSFAEHKVGPVLAVA